MAPLRVDTAPPAEARAMLRTCCGSSAWVDGMMTRRPFGTADALQRAARDVWLSLSPADWLEAIADHPRIGDRAALEKRFPETAHLAAAEQARVADAPNDILDALAQANDEYERRFGHLFVVCARGLTAEEMLDRLRARLPNEPAAELRIAAGEQARIMALRLERL